MRSIAQRRKRSWLSAGVSLVILLALIVAPTCAPLCAAQVCSQASASPASEGHCHPSAATPHKVSQVHRVRHCPASELPPAALTSVSGSEVLLTFVSAASAGSPCAFSQELPGPAHHGVSRCAEPLPALSRKSFLGRRIMALAGVLSRLPCRPPNLPSPQVSFASEQFRLKR